MLLIVNVASKCGLTPQYEGLEALYEAHRDRGFEVLGFPANDFGGQEPGTDEEIVEFCSTNYAVQFPLYSKISVAGDDKHPLYDALTTAVPVGEGGDHEAFRENLRSFDMSPTEDPDVLWNFEKFLSPGTEPSPGASLRRHPRRPGAGGGHRGRAHSR